MNKHIDEITVKGYGILYECHRIPRNKGTNCADKLDCTLMNFNIHNIEKGEKKKTRIFLGKDFY